MNKLVDNTLASMKDKNGGHEMIDFKYVVLTLLPLFALTDLNCYQ